MQLDYSLLTAAQLTSTKHWQELLEARRQSVLTPLRVLYNDSWRPVLRFGTTDFFHHFEESVAIPSALVAALYEACDGGKTVAIEEGVIC